MQYNKYMELNTWVSYSRVQPSNDQQKDKFMIQQGLQLEFCSL